MVLPLVDRSIFTRSVFCTCRKTLGVEWFEPMLAFIALQVRPLHELHQHRPRPPCTCLSFLSPLARSKLLLNISPTPITRRWPSSGSSCGSSIRLVSYPRTLRTLSRGPRRPCSSHGPCERDGGVRVGGREGGSRGGEGEMVGRTRGHRSCDHAYNGGMGGTRGHKSVERTFTSV